MRSGERQKEVIGLDNGGRPHQRAVFPGNANEGLHPLRTEGERRCAVGRAIDDVGGAGAGREIEAPEMRPGDHRLVNQHFQRDRTELDPAPGGCRDVQGRAIAPALRHDDAGGGLDLVGGGSLRIEHDQVPVQHCQLGRRGRAGRVAGIGTGRRQIIQARFHPVGAHRHVHVDRVHILEIPPPSEGPSCGSQFQVAQVDHGSGRPMFAGDPAGIEQGERSGRGGNLQGGVNQAPGRLAQIGLDGDGLTEQA